MQYKEFMVIVNGSEKALNVELAKAASEGWEPIGPAAFDRGYVCITLSRPILKH